MRYTRLFQNFLERFPSDSVSLEEHSRYLECRQMMQNGEASGFEILARIVTILAKIPKSQCRSVVCL